MKVENELLSLCLTHSRQLSFFFYDYFSFFNDKKLYKFKMTDLQISL